MREPFLESLYFPGSALWLYHGVGEKTGRHRDRPLPRAVYSAPEEGKFYDHDHWSLRNGGPGCAR